MRTVILNLIILGMATSVVDDNVFAKTYTERKKVTSKDFSYEKARLPQSSNNIRKKNTPRKSAYQSSDSNYKENKYNKQQQLNDDLSEENTYDSTYVKSEIPPAPPQPPFERNVLSSNIPPAPPMPPKLSGPTPPPPPPMGMFQPGLSNTFAEQKAEDVSIIMEDLRRNLNDFLDENSIKTMANVINLYLQGNKEKISEGISTAESSMIRLNSRLENDLKELNKLSESNSTIEAIYDILQELPSSLKKLSTKGYRAEVGNKTETFRKISQDIKNIAHKYFQEVMVSGKFLKDIPNLKALKDAEIVLERAVVLSDSFSNLVDLSEQSRNDEFSERATRDVLSILNLKRYISDKLKEINLASSKNFISLPTGEIIVEKEYLEKARSYIEKTCKGHDQLQKLLDMRDVLNNKYTIISSNDQVDNKKDPLSIIRKLDDRMADLGNLLQEASETSKNDNFSQFGKMFTEGDVGYGGALIASISQWISGENFADFSNEKIRLSFKGKDLTGDIVGEYIKLLTSDMNLCRSFAKSVISTISRRKNFKASSYSSISKQTQEKKEDRKVLLEITHERTKLGTSSDPKKDTNLISFSTLRKNCEEYVQEMFDAEKEIRAIPEILKKIQRSFSKEIDNKQLAAYINSILSSYFVFKDFLPQGDQISFGVVNTEKGLLSAADTPNVVFALAQNCNLAVKQPALPLFPTSKDTNNMWVFKMALDLQIVISRIIDAISDVSTEISTQKEPVEELSEIIEKLHQSEETIRTAIYQDNVIKQVIDDLQNAISNTENKIYSTKDYFDEVAVDDITDNLKNLRKSINIISNQYKKKQKVDEVILSKIIESLKKVDVEITKTITLSKTKPTKFETNKKR